MAKDNDKKDKKERVIHTRVSEVLDDELKERAQRLGVSVSNLVRNVLQNTFGLVETIVADTAKAVGTEQKRAKASSEVIGYQTLTLNLNALCSECNALLAKGSQAAMGITATGVAGADGVLCTSCVAKVGRDD